MRKATKHRKVFICSPFRPRGTTAKQQKQELNNNLDLAKIACEYAASKGYMPMAPHLFFPAFLSESDPAGRKTGTQFGMEWLSECDELWIIGRRVSEGMKREIWAAADLGIPIRQYTFCRFQGESLMEQIITSVINIYHGYEEDEKNLDSCKDEEGRLYGGDK